MVHRERRWSGRSRASQGWSDLTIVPHHWIGCDLYLAFRWSEAATSFWQDASGENVCVCLSECAKRVYIVLLLLQTWRASDQLMYGSSCNLFTAAGVCPVMYEDYVYILWCTEIYCAILEYTMMYWKLIYCDVLKYTVLYWNILWCTEIHWSYTWIYCAVLEYILLYWTVMYCAISYCTHITCISHVTSIGEV